LSSSFSMDPNKGGIGTKTISFSITFIRRISGGISDSVFRRNGWVERKRKKGTVFGSLLCCIKNQYLRFLAASAFFLRFTLGFS
jgi:hypothetical protein